MGHYYADMFPNGEPGTKRKIKRKLKGNARTVTKMRNHVYSILGEWCEPLEAQKLAFEFICDEIDKLRKRKP